MVASARNSFVPSLLISSAVGVLAVVIFLTLHPVVLGFFSERYLGGSYGDGGLYVWLSDIFRHDPRAAFSFETNALYPYPRTRAWSDSFLLPSLAAFLLVSSGVSHAAAYNSVLLLALGANASASYLLARKLGVAHLFAVATGIVFANSGYFLGNIGHPQLLFFFWVPLAWSFVIPRAKARSWFWAGVCVSGAFYSAVYYAIFIIVGLALVWLAEVVRTGASVRRMFRTLLSCALGALPVLYAVPAYLAVQGYFGTRGLYEAEAFAASAASYLAFSPLHDLYARTATLSHSEAHLGVGFVVLAAALLGIVLVLVKQRSVWGVGCIVSLVVLSSASCVVDASHAQEWVMASSSWVLLVCALMASRRMSSPQGLWFVILTLFFIFSFGPGGNPVKGEPALTPLAVLYERIPGLSAIRAVSRFGSVVILGIIIGAAQALQWLVLQGRKTYLTGVLSACLLCGVGLLENSVSTVPFDAPPERPQAVVEYAKEGDNAGALVYVPFSGAFDAQGVPMWSEFAVLNTRYAQWSASFGGLPTVNGYSGQRSKIQGELAQALRNFPSARAFASLAKICGVTTVLVAPRQGEAESYAGLESPEFSEQIRAVKRFDDTSAIVTLHELSLPLGGTEGATFFAPRGEPARISVVPAPGAACQVTVQSVSKSDEGEVKPLHEERFDVLQPQELRVIAPSRLPAGSPHIIQVRASGCEARVSCWIER